MWFKSSATAFNESPLFFRSRITGKTLAAKVSAVATLVAIDFARASFKLVRLPSNTPLFHKTANAARVLELISSRSFSERAA